MKVAELGATEIAAVSGGDPIDAFLIGFFGGQLMLGVFRQMLQAQEDGTQMGDIQAP